MVSDYVRFRDRDAPITEEGLIFRVYGYAHPPGYCVCDLEYAPETVYKSIDPRSVRARGGERFYKFYFDGGLNFVKKRFPRYQFFYRPLQKNLVGLAEEQISKMQRPGERLRFIFDSDREDALVQALRELLMKIFEFSKLEISDFGVFGSIMHDFYNPKYSDLDLVVYGRKQLLELMEALNVLYSDAGSGFQNEFEGWDLSMPPLHWEFKHYSKGEYGWHQRRKTVYALYRSADLNRTVKVEFEPVRRWSEIANEYADDERIKSLGWVVATVKVLDDSESFFMPSIYPVEVLRINKRFKNVDVERVVSYVEEFRMQLKEGEEGIVRGRLERVSSRGEEFHQITLSYGPSYFKQVLKTSLSK